MEQKENLPGIYLPIVGLIPAGGMGSRIAPLPCSKEIFPIGTHIFPDSGEKRPKVVCHYLLESMRYAGIPKAFLVLRPGKWDIPDYFRDGKLFDIQIAYLIRDLPFGVPFTLDSAFSFTKDYRIACGMPDIIFQPEDVFQRLIQKQTETGADLVLGIFPITEPHKWDQVEFDGQNRITQILTKPHSGRAGYTWTASVWTPEFSVFLHQFVKKTLKNMSDTEAKSNQPEIPLGVVFQEALEAGLPVEHVLFHDGTCLDIGTPEDLGKALHTLLKQT